jgi:hypothetical protein
MGGVFGDKSTTLNRAFARTMLPCYSHQTALFLSMMMCAILSTTPLFVKSVPIPKISDGNEGVDTGEVDDKEMPNLSDVRETVVPLLRKRPGTTAV